MTNRFISWDVPSWTQEIIVEAKISKIGWWDGSAKSSIKIPTRMSNDVKNSTVNDITCPLRVMTFFRFLKIILKFLLELKKCLKKKLFSSKSGLNSLIPTSVVWHL